MTTTWTYASTHALSSKHTAVMTTHSSGSRIRGRRNNNNIKLLYLCWRRHDGHGDIIIVVVSDELRDNVTRRVRHGETRTTIRLPGDVYSNVFRAMAVSLSRGSCDSCSTRNREKTPDSPLLYFMNIVDKRSRAYSRPRGAVETRRRRSGIGEWLLRNFSAYRFICS